MRHRIILYFSIVCFSLGGCTDEKKESSLIQVDVSASYPEKEINLEDVADIEYLQLEMNDDFLFTEEPQIVTTDKVIISRRSDGNILVFSRAGKPVSVFNHKGNGPEEYTNLYGLMYDEKRF